MAARPELSTLTGEVNREAKRPAQSNLGRPRRFSAVSPSFTVVVWRLSMSWACSRLAMTLTACLKVIPGSSVRIFLPASPTHIASLAMSVSSREPPECSREGPSGFSRFRQTDGLDSDQHRWPARSAHRPTRSRRPRPARVRSARLDCHAAVTASGCRGAALRLRNARSAHLATTSRLTSRRSGCAELFAWRSLQRP